MDFMGKMMKFSMILLFWAKIGLGILRYKYLVDSVLGLNLEILRL